MSGAKSITTYKNALASVSTGEDVRNEASMFLAIQNGWEKYLQPAPLTVGILGQLLLVATATDFSLASKPPTGGFKYIKYKDSFRTCLVQLSNDGWNAFNSAHTNMDKIEQYSSLIPNEVSSAIRCLVSGSISDIKTELPKILARIKTSAEGCKSAAKETETMFIDIMSLTGEILEASTSTRSVIETQQSDAEIALATLKSTKSSVEEQQKISKAQLETMEKGFKMAQDNFKAAADSMPSPWEVVGMNFVESLANISNTALLIVAQRYSFGAVAPQPQPQPQPGQPQPGQPKPGQPAQPQPSDPAYLLADAISTQCTTLSALFTANEGKPDWTGIKNGKAEVVSSFLLRLSDSADIKNSSTVAGMELKRICGGGSEVAKKLIAYAKALQAPTQVEINEIMSRAKDLCSDAQKFSITAKLQTGSPPTAGNSLVSPQIPESTSHAAADIASRNAQFKLQQTKEVLNSARESYEKATTKVLESTETVGKLIAEMSRINLQQIDWDKSHEVLIKAIKAIAELRKQWSSLVMFFEGISNIINIALDRSLVSFMDSIGTGQNQVIEGVTLSDFLKDDLRIKAVQAGKIAYFVNTISKTYVGISTEFVMPRVAKLGELAALDPVKDKVAIAEKQKTILSGCEEAGKAIADKVLASNKLFADNVDARIKKIEDAIVPALPTPDPNVVNDTNAALKKAKDAYQTQQAVIVDETSKFW